jgi:flagellar protein FliL
MSEEAPPAEKKPAAPGGGGPGKAVLGLLAANFAGTALVAFKVLTAPPVAAAPAKAEHAEHAKEEGNEVTGPVVALDPFVVNLDEPGQSRYLKVALELEVAPTAEEVLTKSKQLIRDAILSHLSGLHLKDTLGAEAKDKLRSDLLAKVTKLIGKDKVKRMFFQDFVVQ